MALVTTFATTPITLALFPSWYQKKLAAWKRGEIDWDGNRLSPEDTSEGDGSFSLDKDQSSEIRRLLVCLRLDSLPSLFTFVALLGGDKPAAALRSHPTKNGKVSNSEPDPIGSMIKRPLEVHGVRMLELTDRLSSAMKEVEADELSTRDPVVNAFHTFGQLNNVAVSGEVQLVPEGVFSDLLSDRATDRRSDMILLPWSETGNFSEAMITSMTDPTTPHAFGNAHYNHFVSKFLDSAPCNTAVFVNHGFGAAPREEARHLERTQTSLSLRSILSPTTAPLMDRSHHIFFPFIGGDDDRVALRFVLRLAKNPNITATILHLRISETTTVIGTAVTKNETSIATSAQDAPYDQDRHFFTSMADSLAGELQSRVLFDTADSTETVHDALGHARTEVGQSPKNAGDLIVVGRRHAGIPNVHPAHSPGQEGDLRSSLGVLAETIILGSVKASVLVIQAGKKDL